MAEIIHSSLKEKLQHMNQEIEKHVRPDTFPLAIRVLRPGEEIPPKAKRPLRDMQVQLSICQGITMSRRYGWTIAMGGEDLSCPIAKAAFHFEEPLPFYKEGNLAHGMYAETLACAKLTEDEVPSFTKEESGTIVVGPLSRAAFEPDVIVVYGNSAQVMRMVAASLFRTGGAITSEFSARADCADIVIRTIQTDSPQVILPCYGDRVFGQTYDHEMAFSFPYRMSEDVMAGFAGTHKGGVRYPIPNFLQYQAKYPATYEKLNKMWEEE
ncbi:DUF169 domain-containing protein [Aneurinibacillus sp. REN35]|uniref:DUF169 domain-containing protein n=1 Tax=Aneurinibacillus sp. REN35 TaxID=3237286 RepID=UPI0035294426